MKKIFLLLTVSSVLFSCNKAGKNEYIVSGTIKGVDNGKTVILEKQDELGQLVPVDTVKVQDGKFTFKGASTEPEMHLIQVEALQGKVAFILENGDIDITVNKDSINLSKISGTYNNEELSSFKEAGMKIQKKMMKFQQDNMAKMNEAQQKNDTVVVNSLRKEYDTFQKEYNTQSETYLASHPKAFISALIIDGMFGQMVPDIAKIRKFYMGLDQSVKDTKPGKSLKAKLDKLAAPVANATSTEIGSIAPDFKGPNQEGKIISLKESLGKVTIIDFWASWCGPCRTENPNVVALYNELHSKGLNIIGVSLDKDDNKWKEAIVKDKLTWNHISNLKFWQDPIAIAYDVKAIPATFILDSTGKIVAKDLRGDALKAKVLELLAVK